MELTGGWLEGVFELADLNVKGRKILGNERGWFL